MNNSHSFKNWLLAGLLSLFLSACATVDESVSTTEGDGAPVDGTMDGGSTTDDGSSGASATGLDGSDGGDGTAIVDDSSDMAAPFTSNTTAPS